MLSSIVSSMLFLLLLVFSFHMDEAFGAQTEIRKLKETVNMRRNLEGDDHRSSKMHIRPSITKRCSGPKTFKNMATTLRPDHGEFRPLPGGYSSSLCSACNSYSSYCYTISCTTTERCQSFNGSPMTCTRSEECHRIYGH
ncbi:hypothetical protein EUTSA_v10009058mg [Eutrema salsugineum]|uniref:Uncharacterized protein n=1 Tax=Eutrema salsugineum TaxID=72664 RepID=V4KWF9_EUTSA|nr:uncharacterized protein LOC18992552 [Eutrema salsugineum]ESQ34377.1 hypothetical protein EUTSA_v10009058mg [Eutrema salsugineum]